MKRLVIIAILWLACGLGTAGMMNARDMALWGKRFTFSDDYLNRICRQHLAINLFAGPIGLVGATIFIGFDDGWTLSCERTDK